MLPVVAKLRDAFFLLMHTFRYAYLYAHGIFACVHTGGVLVLLARLSSTITGGMFSVLRILLIVVIWRPAITTCIFCDLLRQYMIAVM